MKSSVDRFPEDFMIRLTKAEWRKVITNYDNLPDGVKYSPATPYAFTEQGVATLSSVLKSKKALQVNISIMRAFVLIRKYALTAKDLTNKLAEQENKYDKQFKDVFDAISYLIQKDEREKEQKERRRIGF